MFVEIAQRALQVDVSSDCDSSTHLKESRRPGFEVALVPLLEDAVKITTLRTFHTFLERDALRRSHLQT